MRAVCAKRGYTGPMLRLTTMAEEKRPAPLDRETRTRVVADLLAEHGIFARRMGHANSVGITVTYAHLSQAADGAQATALLAKALDWDDTDVADVAGTVAITTNRG